MGIAVARWDDQLAELLPQGLSAGPAERFFCRGVKFQDALVMVDGDDAIKSGFEHGGLTRFALTQVVLGLATLKELADLSTHRGHQLEEVGVGLAHFVAEELDDAEDLVAQPDGTGEGSVQAFRGGQVGAREIRVPNHVCYPGRPARAPYATRQADSRRHRQAAAEGLERLPPDRRRVPDLAT